MKTSVKLVLPNTPQGRRVVELAIRMYKNARAKQMSDSSENVGSSDERGTR